MAKLTATQALKVIEVSKATLYRDINGGKVSCEFDDRGRKVIDTSELIRVYGEIKTPETQETVSRNGSMKPHETNETVSLLKQKIGFLESQLEDSKKREQDLQQQRERLYQEKEKLLGIVERQTLMLEDKSGEKSEQVEKPNTRPGWVFNPWLVYGAAIGGAVVFSLLVIRYIPKILFGWLLP